MSWKDSALDLWLCATLFCKYFWWLFYKDLERLVYAEATDEQFDDNNCHIFQLVRDLLQFVPSCLFQALRENLLVIIPVHWMQSTISMFLFFKCASYKSVNREETACFCRSKWLCCQWTLWISKDIWKLLLFFAIFPPNEKKIVIVSWWLYFSPPFGFVSLQIGCPCCSPSCWWLWLCYVRNKELLLLVSAVSMKSLLHNGSVLHFFFHSL